MKKRKKKKTMFQKILFQIFKYSMFFIIGLLHIIFIMIIDNINMLISKLFLKLPKITRVLLIYTMIILSTLYIVRPRKEIKKIEVESEEKEIVFVFKEKQDDQTNEEIKEETQNNNIINFEKEIEQKIYNTAIDSGLMKEQALLLLAISKHETGNWTSNAFKNKNNLGGVMCSSGLRVYNNLDEGIKAFVNLLKVRYFEKGLTSVEDIGKIYCPVGASNDPKNVNIYWVPNVKKYFNEYLKKY